MQASLPSALDALAADLSRLLRSKGVTQGQISAATHVPQSTISKALHRKLKRETSDVRALREYANILLGRKDLPEAVYVAAQGFMSAGGSEDELLQAISLTTRLIRGRRSDWT
jgi:transcriptional regulator with XRE-family HTH domain